MLVIKQDDDLDEKFDKLLKSDVSGIIGECAYSNIKEKCEVCGM